MQRLLSSCIFGLALLAISGCERAKAPAAVAPVSAVTFQKNDTAVGIGKLAVAGATIEYEK